MTRDSFVKTGFELALQVLYHRAGKEYPHYFEADDLPDLKDAMVIAGGNPDDQGGYEPLASIFNVFGKRSNEPDKFYDVMDLSEDDNFVYAHTDSGRKHCKDDYVRLVQKFENKYSGRNWSDVSSNEMLRIWQQFTCLVPAEDGVGKMHDVSLYMRTKMATAIGAALAASEDKEKEFLLVSGDISGIQDFIYTIPSKGALKSLRGRSFYLEIFMENFIDELLDELDLTRVNLLYCGGGHFYLLAGNNNVAQKVVKDVKNKCNQWLLRNFGTKLYIALGCVSFDRTSWMQVESQGNIFRNVSGEISKDKMQRYDGDTLESLFSSSSSYNKHVDGSRECAICHTSTKQLMNTEKLKGEVCFNCAGLYDMGKKIILKDCFFVIGRKKEPGALGIFGVDSDLYLYTLDENDYEKDNKDCIRVYRKDYIPKIDRYAYPLNLVDYSVLNKNDVVEDFETLSRASVSADKGIQRLGVLRADVDGLGAAFIAGFGKTNKVGDTNLTRYADLSNALSVFFKRAVDRICERKGLAPEQKRFYLFGDNPGKRLIHVVYSGGDDMFFVGAWEDLIELAVDIREAFRKYTSNKLSFSAGLALFHHAYPVSQMAKQTGVLEDIAKHFNDNAKDSIALFGIETEYRTKEYKLSCKHVYKWENFVNNVCGEKLQYLLNNLCIGDSSDDKNKIKIGKGQLYKLMELLEEPKSDQINSGSSTCERMGITQSSVVKQLEKKNSINFARLVYWLGRLQPADKNEERRKVYLDFTNKMYEWFSNKDGIDHRSQLQTAIVLMVYYLRDMVKEGKNG